MIFLNLIFIAICTLAARENFALNRAILGWVFVVGTLINMFAVAMKLFTWMPQ